MNTGEHQQIVIHHTGEQQQLPGGIDRSFDLLKVLLTVLVALVGLAGGSWLTVLHARMSEMERKLSDVMFADGDRRARLEAAMGRQLGIEGRIDDIKHDVTKRLDQIEQKIDALYSPYGKRR